MPVINIKSLPVQDHTNIPEILIRLNTGVSEALGCDVSHVWSYWEFIKSGFYAAGKSVAAKIHEETHSPMVSIILHEGTEPEKIKAMFSRIAKILSTELEIEYSNVFITITEKKPEMVFDAGELV